MIIETISFMVVQATDLAPFTINGKRHLHYHYFLKDQDGWQFRWIDEHTDIEWLKSMVADGRIYVFND